MDPTRALDHAPDCLRNWKEETAFPSYRDFILAHSVAEPIARELQSADGVKAGELRVGDTVEKVVDYRRHAEECRQLATRMRNPAERDMLLGMAESWEMLADDRERTVGKPRG